ncbi:MAG TPA: CHAT domain-containing protein [Pyrinomonadaceae bacterium]|nr:CHAT domain-containing protein [Pyrinomonadaceae bacterium]
MLLTKRKGSETAGRVILLLCLCIGLATAIFYVPEFPAITTETSSSINAPRQIDPGSSIQGELATGTKDVFEISVPQDQLLRFSIDKGDLLLSTSLYGPTGIKLLEHTSQDFEVVELSFPTTLAGTYRIELQSLERSETHKQYELKINPLTPVTTENRSDSEARAVLAHAEALRADWTKTSLGQAAEQYDMAALIWTSISDFASASHSILKSGDVYFLLGEFNEALKRYQNAETFAAKTDDWLARARSLSHLGRLYVYVGNNDEAQEQLTKALRLLEQHEGNRTAIGANAYGEALSNLAEVSYSKGNFVRSSKQLDNALNIFQNDRKGEAKVHLFKGYIAGSIGETEKAAAEIMQAQELYRATNDKIGEALTMTTLAVRYARYENYNLAIEMYLKAKEVFRSTGDRHNEAITLNGLAESHQELREFAIALSEYESALRLFEEIGAFDGASVTAFQIATAYSGSGHLDQALAYYERCLKLSRAAKKVRTEANALVGIAQIYVAQHLYKQAAEQFKKVLKFYESIGDLRGQAVALNAYGDFLLQVGATSGALDAYQRALAFSEQVGEQNIRIAALYNLARANLALGDPDAALSFIHRSLKIVEDVRANVASPEFRLSYFSGVQKHYALCIQILMQLERLKPGQGFAAEAFLVSERGRARLVSDLVTESRVNVHTAATNELIERERKLIGLLSVQAEYRLETALNERDAAEIAEADKQMVQLRAEYETVEAQIRQQNPRLSSLEELKPLTLQQIQNELRGSDTMLLEYTLGTEHSYLWSVTSDSLQAYELPAGNTIEDAAREFYKLVTARQEGDEQTDTGYPAKVEMAERLVTEKASSLSQMLLGPVASQLGTRRLLVVTDGALQYVPFQALPLPLLQSAGLTEVKSESKTLLIETNEVVVLPSALTLIAIRSERNHAASSGKLVAVIADPVFSSDDERVQRHPVVSSFAVAANEKNSNESLPQILETGARGLTRLSHASEEADAIFAVAPWGTTMVAKGFDASRETVMSSDLSQYQIVHFATHGYLDAKHPELSGLVLTMLDRNGVRTNGFMPLYDIYGLNLSTEVTVLSACQTALGKEIKGEGLVGLTHGFISAGSKSVVASLWKVDDRATAVLMTDFYDGVLRKGMTPSAALRSAQMKMMRNKQWSAPYYWAGFVLEGEYINHITVDGYAWLRRGLVLLFSVLLIAAALLMLQKRKRRTATSEFT